MNTAQPIDTDRIDGTPRTVRELFTSRRIRAIHDCLGESLIDYIAGSRE